jgi:hypothetical protein
VATARAFGHLGMSDPRADPVTGAATLW